MLYVPSCAGDNGVLAFESANHFDSDGDGDSDSVELDLKE